jgi:hypothetical protein
MYISIFSEPYLKKKIYEVFLFNIPQALDVWTPLFPVDPPFSTKLNFTNFIFFPLNTALDVECLCIKH